MVLFPRPGLDPGPRLFAARVKAAGSRVKPGTGRASTELPLPAERIAVHHLDALGRKFVPLTIKCRKILLRAKLLAEGNDLLNLLFANGRCLGSYAQIGTGQAIEAKPQNGIELSEQFQSVIGRYLFGCKELFKHRQGNSRIEVF